jgi:lipid-binding SYLF domain-containing protein
MSAEMLAYSRAQGVFAGIDLSGGVLRPDKGANAKAYGPDIASRDVLLKPAVVPPPAARAFLRTLASESRATSGRQ